MRSPFTQPSCQKTPSYTITPSCKRASLFPGPGMSFFRPRDLFQPRKVFFLASVFFQASLRGPKKTNVFLTTLFAAVKEGTTVFFSTPQRLVTDPASFSGPRNVFFQPLPNTQSFKKEV